MNEQKQEFPSLTLYVVFSIFMCLVFTTIILIMSGFRVMVPDVLITCFYCLFGGEIVTCGLIKIFKLREKDKEDEG